MRAFLLNRGIWLFCQYVESEVEAAGARVKNPSQAGGLRQSTLMKYLYPEDPSKRFRAAKTPGADEKAEPSANGEEFFTKNFGKRRGR